MGVRIIHLTVGFHINNTFLTTSALSTPLNEAFLIFPCGTTISSAH